MMPIDASLFGEQALKLALSIICSGLIGFEREKSNHPAGMRTHIMVCITSCLVMLTSQFMFVKYSGRVNLDPMRLGAQIISGIGFLGAGAIVKDGSIVRGLTTAASLWSVAAIGIALGVGFYFGGVVVTVLMFSILIYFRKFERILRQHRMFYTVGIEIRTEGMDNILKQIDEVFVTFKTKFNRVYEISINESSYVRYEFFLLEFIPSSEIIEALRAIDGVFSVQ
ncbi:MAG: MgtC/SapB family protein [Eubacteriaceae bacterium]|nr:MgtC/SapB family protein [Eubacteriaceae bacterium]